jgi:hypothetical protein
MKESACLGAPHNGRDKDNLVLDARFMHVILVIQETEISKTKS